MCGRFVEFSSIPDIKKAFDINRVSQRVNQQVKPPRYNIAPGQNILTVVQPKKSTQKNANESNRILTAFLWGFIPFWAKDKKKPQESKIINARGETLAQKSTFKSAFKNQRCLIVADGFYEWQQVGESKRPYFVKLESKKTLALAGIYDIWEQERTYTCSVITTKANEDLEKIHPRMPAIVPPESYQRWLNPNIEATSESEFDEILHPFISEKMSVYPVSARVNIPRNDSPENIKEIKIGSDSTQAKN